MRWKTPLALALALGASPVSADLYPPDPTYSTVPECIVACPQGDIEVVIVVRDTRNIPIPGSMVRLDFSACPMFAVCDDLPPGPPPYVIDREHGWILAFTNAIGMVRLPLRMGGVCPSGIVRIHADNFPLGESSLVTPDQDGDMLVAASDVTLFESKIGSNDSTGDFDCDGTVEESEGAVIDAHFDHSCAGPTPVRPLSWGAVKLIYR